jgi:hypothetical protein
VSGRRLILLVVLLAAIGLPAGLLSATCANGSCVDGVGRASPIPFCPLPAELQDRLANGYREGRSPDVLGVANRTPLYTDADGRTAWPSASVDGRVPLVFAGSGARPMTLPDGVALDSVAPTVSEILGFDRPFPGVRSGRPIADVANGQRPRLVLLVAWKGVGSADLESTPPRDRRFLSSLFEDGSGTTEANAGSLPLDPAATLTTIGTGGLPSQHGITGSVVRNEKGRVVEAFGTGAPVTVIASLADDLDHAERSSRVAAVITDRSDLGIVGDGWYRGGDPVDIWFGDSAEAARAVEAELDAGYGADDAPDILAVVLAGDVRSLDRWTRRIVDAAERATAGSTLTVVAGTGSREASAAAADDGALVRAVEAAVPGSAPAVASVVPGGLFLDQDVLRREHVTGLVAVEAMRSVSSAGGEPLLADAFQGFAVSFARYC